MYLNRHVRPYPEGGWLVKDESNGRPFVVIDKKGY
ncbi:DUF2188 domain-containing protein [Desulforamulus aeronauticus]|nr:DUF2188 domain-containing protein [Desulforamulus aeronauticus]